MNTNFTKPTEFIVRIPESCHEDWNQMHPDAKGKFCNACCKPVYDFSIKTPHEIQAILSQHRTEKVCGYFKETQLDRPLSAMPAYDMMSVTKRFALALYLVFGSLLFSCKTVPEPEQDGPIFQKGRFTTNELHADSTRRRYGGADYLDYLTPEVIDSVLALPK